MKKIVSLILTLAMCFAVCFALVGCNNEFSGNFKTEATSEQIEETFDEVEDAEVATKNVTGLQLKAEVKATGTYAMSFNAEIKVNFEKKQAMMEYSATDKEENESGHIGLYIKDNMLYTDSKIGAISSQYKTQLPEAKFEEKTQTLFDGKYFNISQYMDIFDESVNDLKEMGVKVYIDSTIGTKIKIVFDTNKDAKEVYSGSAIYVFDSANNLTAIKYDVSVKSGTSTDEYSAYIEMTSFSGTIKLPSKAEEWNEGIL